MMNQNETPIFRRARGFRLYTPAGDRFLDLSLDRGRALMGHRPGKQTLVLKNTLSAGLSAPYDTVYGPRLEKLLAARFPGKGVRIVNFQDRRDFPEPAPVFRPYDPVPETGTAEFLIPAVLPCGVRVYIGEPSDLSGPSDRIPGAAAAAMVRALFDLTRYEDSHPGGLWDRFAALPGKVPGTPFWRIPLGERAYGDFVRESLAKGFVLPESPEDPAILPGEWSPGEAAALVRLGESLP